MSEPVELWRYYEGQENLYSAYQHYAAGAEDRYAALPFDEFTAIRDAAYRRGLEDAARLCVRRSCSWDAADDERSQDFREGIELAASQLASALRAWATPPPATP